MKLSVVIPALNEEAGLGTTLAALAGLRRSGHEVIVVDGGSSDRTREIAGPLADRVLEAPRGRARQMNAGAHAATGDVLLFLHADTLLPVHAVDRLLAAMQASGRSWGRFDVRIAGSGSVLALVAAAMNLRSRLTGIATGDQAIFVRRALFERAGGFPELALMEDIALSRTLLRVSRPICLRQRVQTSGRRWEQHGVLRTVLLMWWLRLRFFLGTDPARLAQRYEGRRIPSCILVFAKAPEPGKVKTRLIPALGEDGAASLHERLTMHALQTARAAGVGPVQLWCAPDAAHPFFTDCSRRFGVTLHAQGEGTLGDRMDRALRAALDDAERAVLVGSDIPSMTGDYLREADEALRKADVVLGPAEDGGYVLIGLKRAAPELFRDIAWGEGSVLAVTRQRIAGLRLHCRELTTLWDVDTPADVRRLQEDCGATSAETR